MPEPDYVDKLYGIMSSAYGESFTHTPESFRNKITTDSNYTAKVFGIMKDAYGDDFTHTNQTFYDKVGLKKKDNSPKPLPYGSNISTSPSDIAEKTVNPVETFEFGVTAKKPKSVAPKPFTNEVKPIGEEKFIGSPPVWGQKQQEPKAIAYESDIPVDPNDPEKFLGKKQEPKPSYEKVKQAYELSSTGQYDQSNAVIEQEISADPNNTYLLELQSHNQTNQAADLFSQGKFTEAQNLLVNAKQNIDAANALSKQQGKPLNISTYIDGAELSLAQGDKKAAKGFIQPALYANNGQVTEADTDIKIAKAYEIAANISDNKEQQERFTQYSKSRMSMAKQKQDDENYKDWVEYLRDPNFSLHLMENIVNPTGEMRGIYEGVKRVGEGVIESTAGAIEGVASGEIKSLGDLGKQELKSALDIVIGAAHTYFSASMLMQWGTSPIIPAAFTIANAVTPEISQKVMMLATTVAKDVYGKDVEQFSDIQKGFLELGDIVGMLVLFEGAKTGVKYIGKKTGEIPIGDQTVMSKLGGISKKIFNKEPLTDSEVKTTTEILDKATDENIVEASKATILSKDQAATGKIEVPKEDAKQKEKQVVSKEIVDDANYFITDANNDLGLALERVSEEIVVMQKYIDHFYKGKKLNILKSDYREAIKGINDLKKIYIEIHSRIEVPKEEVKPVKTKSVETTSGEKTSTGGGVQSQEKVTEPVAETPKVETTSPVTLDRFDVEKVDIPENIESEMFWQEKLVEHLLNETGVDYVKEGAKTTGSTYYNMKLADGESYKLRLADHPKKYSADGNIEYSKETTPYELMEKLRDVLPDEKILKKEPPPANDTPATTKVEPVEDMVLYRGASKNSKNSGRYLSDSYDYAKSFANTKSNKGGMGDVQEIKLKKGTKIFESGDDTGLSGMVDKIKDKIPDLTSAEIDKIKNREYNDVLEKRGYDGISYTEGDSQSNKVSTTVELFNPDKSIESKTVKNTAIFSESVKPVVEKTTETPKETKPVSENIEPESLGMSVSRQLPLSPKDDPRFKDSPINNVLTLKQIGRTLLLELNLTEGQSVRKGLISRFKRKAEGLFFSKDGIIRVKSMNDINVLSHEIGHYLDKGLLDIKNTIPRPQYNAVASELKGMLKKQGYPKITTAEGIAEFVRRYVVDRANVQKDAPQFNSFFEKLLDNNDSVKTALNNAENSVVKFGSQDARAITMSTIQRNKTSNLSGIRSLTTRKIIYNLFDNLQFVRALNKSLLKEAPKTPSENQPIFSALSLIGIDGKAKQFLENSPFQRVGNDIELVKNVDGIVKLISPLLKNGNWQHYEAYMVALRNIELHARGLDDVATTTLDIAKRTKDLYENDYGKDVLGDFQKKYMEYNHQLLKYYKQSGKLSQEALDKINDLNKFYIPFKRAMDEFDMTGAVDKISNKLYTSSPSPVKGIKGSDENISSPFESAIKNTYDILAAADRNIALKNIVDALKTIQGSKIASKKEGGLIQEIPKGKVVGSKDLKTGDVFFTYKVEAPRDKAIISVWEDGVQKFYEIPKEYYEGLFNINESISNAIRVLSLPSRWLQAGSVVYDPTFFARNIPRDQMSGMFYSKFGYSPVDFIKGIVSGVGKDEYYQKWLASGGDQSFLVAMDKVLSKNYVSDRIGNRMKTRFEMYGKNPLLAIQDLGRASEAGTRIGAFRNAYKKTKGDSLKAMEESRIIGADYGTKGASMKNIAPLYPFLNARMQHLKLTALTIKDRPIQTTLKGLAFVTVPSILNWIANNSNEEDRKRYQALPEWRRLGLFNVHIPGTDSYLPIPKGFWGTLFGTSAEAMLDNFVGVDEKISDDRMIKQLHKQLFRELSPISNLVEIIPQFGRPAIEQWANKKGFSDKPIIPESMKGLLPEEQYTENTPEILKKIGGITGVSPLRIEAIISGYGGGAIGGAIRISDEILQLIGVVDPKPDDDFTRLSRLPLTKAFITETPSGSRSSYVQDFYKILDGMEEINKTVNMYVSNDNNEKCIKYLSNKKRKSEYLYYLNNKKSIDDFRKILRFSYELKIEITKDKYIDYKDKRKQIKEIDEIITDNAIDFANSHKENKPFVLSENIKKYLITSKSGDKDEQQKREDFKKEFKNQTTTDESQINEIK